MVGRILIHRAQRGLTLVELLVVIVILALASAVVMLNAPPVRPEARDDAERFAARMQLAMDEAIARGAVMRVSIDATGYGFETMKAGEWAPIEESRALSRMTFDKRTVATPEVVDAANDNADALGDDDEITMLADEDEEEEKVRRIGLDPLGTQTPFTVRFASPAGAWIVAVDEAASVTVKQDE